MSKCRSEHFAIEFFSKMPYGYFVIPSLIIILHTFVIMFLVEIYSLDASYEYKYYFGKDDPILIFLSRLILIITLAVILKTAETNLDQIWNLGDDIRFLFKKEENRIEVFKHIKNDVFSRNRAILNYRIIYSAIPIITILYSYLYYTNGIHSNLAWFFSIPIQIITWSLWWTLIFYGTYSGVIGANIVLYLFDSERSGIKYRIKYENKSSYAIIKKIINRTIAKINKSIDYINGVEVKFDDTGIDILNPDKLGGLSPVKTLLKSPIIIGISAIIMSSITIMDMQEKKYLLFTDLSYYILILMCTIIPPYVFSGFLTKKKQIHLQDSYKKLNNYEKIPEKEYYKYSMKTNPFDTNYIIQIFGLIITIGLSLPTFL